MELNETLFKDEIKVFILQLANQFKPQTIIQFGKNITTAECGGCFGNTKTEARCHLFLLMIVQGTTKIENGVQEYATPKFSIGIVNILVHSEKNLLNGLANNNRFFIKAYNEGLRLYAHDGYICQREKYLLDNTLLYKPTTEAVIDRFFMAEGFLHSANEALEMENYNLCAFLANQVVEQSCVALIKLYMDYKSDVHNIFRLLDLICCFSDKPKAFFCGSDQTFHLLEIINKSYSHARYNDSYVIEEDEAKNIISLVSLFLKHAKELGTGRLAEMEAELPADYALDEY